MILQRRSRGLLIFHGACQLLIAEILFALFIVAVPVELAFHRPVSGLSNYGMYALVVAFAIVVDIARCVSRNVPLLQLSTIENIRRSGRQAFTILVALLLVLVAAKDTSISRMFLFGYVAAYYVVSLLVNKVLPPFLAATAFGKRHQKRTVILGDTNRSRSLLDWLDDRSAFGIKVVGFLETGDRTPLEQRLREHGAQQLILLGLPKSTARMSYYCRACERAGTRLMVMSDMLQEFGRSITIDEHEDLQFISFHRDLLECPYNRLMKRLFDISIALPVSLFVLPTLAVLVWLTHRIQAPGPLFFRQTRTGADGTEFSIFKFRTMRVHNEDESRQASQNDPRIFAAGAWLRKTSLDEIPQFLNVLLGEMSIVGPRPHLKAHDDQFAEAAEAYRFRQFIKPGITGLAQVTGFRGETRGHSDIRNRVQADIEYLEKWSLSLDFSIVCRTAWQMIVPPKSAY